MKIIRTNTKSGRYNPKELAKAQNIFSRSSRDGWQSVDISVYAVSGETITINLTKDDVEVLVKSVGIID